MTIIKIMLTRKKLLIFVLLIFAFALFLCACSEKLPDTSVNSEPDQNDVEVSVPEFSSASEAKRALVALTDEKIHKELYTEEWYSQYREILSQINSLLRSPPEDENQCISACTQLYETLLIHKATAQYLRRDVPVVYISCPKEIGREEYVDATVRIVDSKDGGNGDIKEDITIRVRGNSTAVSDKKPYNIKFAEKTSVLGMPEGRKWCLIANHFDKTLMRNKLAFDLSASFGDIYAIQSKYCDVYVNGVFKGNYLICQPVSDGVLGIDTKKGDFIVERIVVLEGENDFFLRGDAGYVFDTPERSELSRDEQREIIKFMQQVDNAVASGNQKEITKLIDLDSFVSAYVIHEVLKDCDIVTGSTYFYRKNGVLYAGPIWDMDLSTGNVSHYYFQDKYHIYNNDSGFGDKSGDSASGIWAQQEWFYSLMQCNFFRDAASQKYAEMADEIKNLYSENGYIDTLCKAYGESFARNYSDAGWSISAPYCDYEDESPNPTFEGNVTELKEWLSRRDSYLRDYFNIK